MNLVSAEVAKSIKIVVVNRIKIKAHVNEPFSLNINYKLYIVYIINYCCPVNFLRKEIIRAGTHMKYQPF